MKKSNHETKDMALFNRIAKEYFIKDVYPVSSAARKFQLLSLIDLIKNKKRSYNLGYILELGCGVGASAKYLNGFFESYTGIDYSEEFIKLAKDHFTDQNNEFICANIKDFELNTEKIDFVFGVGVLHHVSNLDEVLANLKKVGDDKTVFGFIEPQSLNPVIQIMRKLRMVFDKRYSTDQTFFKKSYIKNLFEKNGYQIISIKYQGYFTPPFAQVIIKPAIIFNPIVKMFISLDKFIQNYLNNPFSWNIIWIAKKK